MTRLSSTGIDVSWLASEYARLKTETAQAAAAQLKQAEASKKAALVEESPRP